MSMEALPLAFDAAPPPVPLEEERSLLAEILDAARIGPADTRRDLIVEGLRALGAWFELPGGEERVIDRALLDLLIADIDSKMSRQLTEILHHPPFQRLEAAWRGLRFVVDRTDFRE